MTIDTGAGGINPDSSTDKHRARVLAITSGKGGVGKTNISTNLAIALAQSGKKVCVFDADTSLANVNILLGIQPRHTLEQLISGQATLDEILVAAPGGISIIPAASGIAELTRLNESEQQLMIDALAELEQRFDYLLVDTAAGIGRNVLMFLQAARHCLLVVSPEPTSLTDAFALAKVLKQKKSSAQLHVLVNMAGSYTESIDVYKRLAAACRRYLDMEPDYFGYIPRDDYLRMAVQEQKPVVLSYPTSDVSRRFISLARSLDEMLGRQQSPGLFSRFWQRLALRNAGTLSKAVPAQAGSGPEQTRLATPTARKYPKAVMVKIHQGMVGLIRSRQLPSNSMRQLMGSLLKLVARHYPEIDIDELKDQRTDRTKKR